jgi:predicted phage terminase large subunit-like protein
MRTVAETQRETAVRTFRESVHSRVIDAQTSAIILIMQRLHMFDVSAIALEYGYEHLMLPMEFEPERKCYTCVNNGKESLFGRYNAEKQIWLPECKVKPEEDARFRLTRKVYPQDRRTRAGELLFTERYPIEIVERDKAIMGSFAYAGQAQQRPAPREGGMFKRHWFKIIDVAPVVQSRVRRWDLAASEVSKTMTDPDWTAGVDMGRTRDGMFIVFDVERFREGPHATRDRIRAIASQDRVKQGSTRIVVPQDTGQSGKFQAQDLVRFLAGYNARAVKETGSKEVRAEPFAAQCEAGNVYLVKGKWNEAFIDELCNFPAGHDDQVDAASGAFEELTSRGEIRIGALKGTI